MLNLGFRIWLVSTIETLLCIIYVLLGSLDEGQSCASLSQLSPAAGSSRAEQDARPYSLKHRFNSSQPVNRTRLKCRT